MLKGRNGAVFCFFFFLLSKKLPVFSKKKRFDDDPLRERRVLTNSPQKRKVFMPKIKLYFRALRFSFSVQWKANGLALVLYGSLLLIATTATLVTTRLFQMVLDAIAAKTQLPALLPLAVLLALSLVLQRAARGFSSRLNDRARQKAIEEYERILIRHTSSLPAAFIDSKAGRILPKSCATTPTTLPSFRSPCCSSFPSSTPFSPPLSSSRAIISPLPCSFSH